ncbi:MAG TPA: hypothetical protein VHL98_18660 [Microvirga sp.]|nr:hypothetical protein [Microvirga sp.]
MRRRDDGLFLALKVHPEDAQAIAAFVEERGIKPIAPGDMHVTLLRLNRGVFDLEGFAMPAEVRAGVGPYGLYSRAEHGITHAAYVAVEREPIAATRTALLKGYKGIPNPFTTPAGALEPAYRQMVRVPHLTLTFHRSEHLLRAPFPLPAIRLTKVIASRPDPFWHRRHL